MGIRALQDRVSRAAMTQIELIVVISICGILIALLLPAVQRVRDSATRISCASNLRQLSLGVHMYADAHRYLPTGCFYPEVPGGSPSQCPGMSWHTSVLPYIERATMWAKAEAAYRADPRGDSWAHIELSRTIIPTYLCPAESYRIGGFPQVDHYWANTSYLGVAGSSVSAEDGVFHPGLVISLTDISDGTSNTVMVGERPPGFDGFMSGWYSRFGSNVCRVSQILPANDSIYLKFGKNCSFPPEPLPLRLGVPNDGCSMGHFWSLHSGGANFALADASVRFLSYNIGPVLLELATRNGGEVVDF